MAIIYACRRANRDFDGIRSGPLLLAIDARKSLSVLRDGKEPGEIEISGLINFKDITIINNKSVLWKFISMLNLDKPDKYLYWLMHNGLLVNGSAVLHPDCTSGKKY